MVTIKIAAIHLIVFVIRNAIIFEPLKVVFDFSQIIFLSENFNENQFKETVNIFKEFKIHPKNILFSRINIADFIKSKYRYLSLSREQTHLFKFPQLVYDKKDRFKQRDLAKGISISKVSDSKIKGRVFLVSLETFLENFELNPSTYHSFLKQIEITQVFLLSNKVLNDESTLNFKFFNKSKKT